MRKSLIAMIVIGIVIIIMSSLRIIVPIVNDVTIPNLRYTINVTPGMNLIINGINGSLSIRVVKGYQGIISTLDLFAPLFAFMGILMILITFLLRGKNLDFSNPLFFTVMIMVTASLLLSLPLPLPVYVQDGSSTAYILIGVNAYVGFASLVYLMGGVLLLFNSRFYNQEGELVGPYLDIDQLASLTIRLKEEGKTEGLNGEDEETEK
ncbi:hypothetical protein [Vulcanisaeta thermophila]|uniref:hypothetical protein n=1 Tax=Vulcanisaeta thermophila TaxID=867917 RepID=UPI0008535D77|nr:hypothetical protein [Vulcanisaeta thermophila]